MNQDTYEKDVQETTEIKRWCAYLAILHTVLGEGVQLPISPACARPFTLHGGPDWGCGTCRGCTEQMIIRALFCGPGPLASHAGTGHALETRIFEYLTRLDPRLTDGRGQYVILTGSEYARVMNWAATIIPHEYPVSSGAQTAPLRPTRALKPAVVTRGGWVV